MKEDGAICLEGKEFGVDQVILRYSIPPIDEFDLGKQGAPIRLFLPPDMQGGQIMAPYVCRVEELLSSATSDEEHDYWLETRLLIDLSRFTGGLDKKEQRRLDGLDPLS